MIQTILTNQDLENQELIDELNESINPTVQVDDESDRLPGEDRGAYLHRSLGLDKVKGVRYRSSGSAKVVDEEALRRKEAEKQYETAKNKVWSFKEEDFSIDLLTNKWKHKSWKTWLKGGDDYAETKKLVKRYIEECAKPYGTRDLSFIHLVKDKQ